MNMNELEGLTKQEKVFRLTVELLEVKRRKKEEAAAFRDEIKDLEAEIKAQTEEEDEK